MFYRIEVQVIALVLNVALSLGVLAWMRYSVRGVWALWLMGVLAALIFHLFPIVKIAFLGEPIVVSDLWAGAALFQILTGWRKLLAVAGIILVLGGLTWALWPRRGGLRYLFGASVTVALMSFVMVWASDKPWFPDGAKTALFQKVGGAVFLVADVQRYWRESGDVPSHDDVAGVTRGILLRSPEQAGGGRPRNIHVLLVEAAWDVRQLKAYRFSSDPWDSRFRSLWEQGGSSRALTPVFGGATANAEFELLCGMPAGGTAIVFQDRLKNYVPCLPRVLREAGYRVQASHPYKQEFWSRDRAYRLVGFETYNAGPAFERDEMDGSFLSDTSLLRQVLAHEQSSSDPRPLFNYVVTLSSHYPYERDVNHRPSLVEVEPSAPLLRDYANGIRYSTGAVMDTVEAIRSRDPDALIVITGDHAPVLGSAPNPYKESGLFLPGETADPSQVLLMKTPLIVIDGQRGVVSLGDTPMRRVPAVILGLLGAGAPAMPVSNWEENQPQPWSSHVFLGKLFIRRADMTWHGCWPGEAECAVGLKQQENLALLRRDLVRGHRYAMGMLGASRLLVPTRMTISEGSCRLPFADWGPKSVPVGEAFFPQPDGRNALWLKLTAPTSGSLFLEIAGERSSVLASKDMASASFQGAFLARPGVHSVFWGCGDKQMGSLGTIKIGGTASAVPVPATKPPSVTAGDAQVPKAPACSVRVVDWGPRTFRSGAPFNRQADGRSAYWVKLAPGSEGFGVSADGVIINAVRAGDMLTFLHDAQLEKIASRDGKLKFDLMCGDRAASSFDVLIDGASKGKASQ